MVLRSICIVALALGLAACDTAPDAPPQADGEVAASPAGGVGERPVIEPSGDPAPAELTVEDLVVGDGPRAEPGATVTVHYVGASWSTGEEFESSWERRNPRTFLLDATIPGFRDGVVGMAVGGRRRIVIPPDLAYGDQPPSGIGRRDTIVFVVDLVAVR